MKVRALRAIAVKVTDGVVLSFEPEEIKDLEPLDAALALVNAGWDQNMKCFPLKLEGRVPIWPGSLITWIRENNLQGPATVLASIDLDEEGWLVVMDWVRQQGHLVRKTEVLDVNPINMLSAVILVLQSETDEERKDAAKQTLIDLLAGVCEGNDSIKN